jgi:hypothetical protein
MTKQWTPRKNTLPNLHVYLINDREKGFIYKLKDSKTDKNAWCCHTGIGDATHFLGHASCKSSAKNKVEKALTS